MMLHFITHLRHIYVPCRVRCDFMSKQESIPVGCIPPAFLGGLPAETSQTETPWTKTPGQRLPDRDPQTETPDKDPRQRPQTEISGTETLWTETP